MPTSTFVTLRAAPVHLARPDTFMFKVLVASAKASPVRIAPEVAARLTVLGLRSRRYRPRADSDKAPVAADDHAVRQRCLENRTLSDDRRRLRAVIVPPEAVNTLVAGPKKLRARTAPVPAPFISKAVSVRLMVPPSIAAAAPIPAAPLTVMVLAAALMVLPIVNRPRERGEGP